MKDEGCGMKIPHNRAVSPGTHAPRVRSAPGFRFGIIPRPSSVIPSQEASLAVVITVREPEVFVGGASGVAAARGAVEEAELEQEGLAHVLDGVALHAEGGCQRLDADGAAVVLLDDSAEVVAVEWVQ